jgi:hypothetical protein
LALLIKGLEKIKSFCCRFDELSIDAFNDALHETQPFKNILVPVVVH